MYLSEENYLAVSCIKKLHHLQSTGMHPDIVQLRESQGILPHLQILGRVTPLTRKVNRTMTEVIWVLNYTSNCVCFLSFIYPILQNHGKLITLANLFPITSPKSHFSTEKLLHGGLTVAGQNSCYHCKLWQYYFLPVPNSVKLHKAFSNFKTKSMHIHLYQRQVLSN